ncbi:MAG: hypothetical protein COB36_10720 [Alphaproteobacteria bacterium]|nr:MAG: hypothetical protein COB36_10720 [Alphaproteobacteria bacterium]
MNLEELYEQNPEVKDLVNQQIQDQATTLAEKTSQGLMNKNNELMDELKPLKQKMKLLDGIDPEKYREMQQSIKDKETQGFVDKGQIDKIIEAHNTEKLSWGQQYEQTTTELNGTISTLKSSLEKEVIDNQLLAALSPIAVDEPSLEYLMMKTRGQVEMVDIEGRMVARVKNGINGDGSYKMIPDLVQEIAGNELYARFVKGTQGTGSGANGSDVPAGGNGAAPKTWAECKTVQEKQAFLKAQKKTQ